MEDVIDEAEEDLDAFSDEGYACLLDANSELFWIDRVLSFIHPVG